MRPCEITYNTTMKTDKGMFLGWGREDETGATMAIVEVNDGSVHFVSLHRIRFADKIMESKEKPIALKSSGC